MPSNNFVRDFVRCMDSRSDFDTLARWFQPHERADMNWYFTCPVCHKLHHVPWEERANTWRCGDKEFTPPTPAQDHAAYVDDQAAPQEMADVVHALKGKVCTVAGCAKPTECLDHRQAYSKGGRTSVQNLYPMCDDHNLAKGDKTWGEFLVSLVAKSLPS